MKKKTAFIIGGSRGIGGAITELFAREGYKVFFTYNSSQIQADSIRHNLEKSGYDAVPLKCDIRNREEVEKVFDIAAEGDDIDTVVLNAGIASKNFLTNVTDDEFNHLTYTNLRGTFYAARKAASLLMWRRKGGIIFVSSILGQDGCSCESVYSMTKGGINAFAKSLAKELGQFGIRVNTVCPGLIDTDMNSGLSKAELAQLVNQIPLRRIGTPSDVANAVLFLAQADYVTGIELTVSGGAFF